MSATLPVRVRYFLTVGESAPSLDGLKRLPGFTLPGDRPGDFHIASMSAVPDVVGAWMQEQSRAIELACCMFSCSEREEDRPYIEAIMFCFRDSIGKLGNSTLDWMQGLCHAIENFRLLDDPGISDNRGMKCPAIAVGAGPSLVDGLDEIRRIQRGALVVSCDAAVPVLIDAGIVPDLVTPVERVHVTADVFSKANGVRLAANPVLLPAAVRSFARRMRVTQSEHLYRWWNPDRDDRAPLGRSTGTAAVGIALRMVDGPVYLVGHDLTYGKDGSSHAGGVDKICHLTSAGAVQYDGHVTRPEWVRFSRDIQELGHAYTGRLVRVRPGLPIIGVSSGILPRSFHSHKPALNDKGTPGNAERFLKRCRAMIDRLKSRRRGSINAEEMADGDDCVVPASILRPIYLSVSMGRRQGLPHRNIGQIVDKIVDQCISYMEVSYARACNG